MTGSERLFTVICEFRGGTYAAQVTASNERNAIRGWITHLREQRPIPRFSGYLANSIEAAIQEDWSSAVALDGLSKVWYFGTSCGEAYMHAHIVETVDL